MFGFLKDKLKKAVAAFSKSAQDDIKEEKVDDKHLIEEAKKQEQRIVKKQEQKAEQKKVEQKKKAASVEPKKAEPKKAEIKIEPKAAQERTPTKEKTSEKAAAEKPVAKPVPAHSPAKPEPVAKPKHEGKQRHEEKPLAVEPTTAKEEQAIPKAHGAKEETRPKKADKPHDIRREEKVKEETHKRQEPAQKRHDAKQPVQPVDEKKDEKKPGFFSKIFGRKKETDSAPTAEEETTVTAESTTISRIDEELARTDDAIDEEIESIEENITEDRAVEEHVQVIARSRVEEPALDEAEEDETEESAAKESGGFFGKLKDAFTKKQLSPEKFDELFWELEVAMLENNVAVEVIEKIKTDLRDELTSGKVNRMGIEDMITSRLRQSVEELFDVPTFDLLERIKSSRKSDSARPFVACIIGVNGSGKTTTLAKLIHLLQKNHLTVVVAASDTFRAAAIDQLREHTERLGVKLISQGYGADPAAVAFDAIKHAGAQNIDVVLVDTAGRLHSNTNLMAELEKVVRVAKPDMKIFVGESITGNDCVEQAQVFNKLVGIDAIILSKADIDEKGGAAISVSYVTGKPILYLGTGQTYDDLEPFDKEKIIESLDLE